MGCGTALPSVVMFQWLLAARQAGRGPPLALVLADYNPAVLHLVTLPNLVVAWALWRHAAGDARLHTALASAGELELTTDVTGAFREWLREEHIALSFLSGGWSPGFVDLLYQTGVAAATPTTERRRTLVLGAETIYSPFALESFTQALLLILEQERRERPTGETVALVAAKRVYFGVGGSLDEFVDTVRRLGVTADLLREETEGVRRGVVRCVLR